jgi:DNA polymerase-3 subunit gamma/tau
MSLREINSANNRGVDTAREIDKQMRYIPAGSGVLVYIIDEAHRTTRDFQEAMLKPLEDTPDHVYFFLCTTEPGKLITALKNRCTQVKVVTQDDETLRRMLKLVAREEEIKVSKEIIEEIAENSNGSPRQALVILEKVSEMDDEKSMREVISIGEEAEKEVIELCRALLKSDNWGDVAGILRGLKDIEVEKIRYAVLGYMNSVLLKSSNQRAGICIECFEEPFYNSGRAGLTLACYQVIVGE